LLVYDDSVSDNQTHPTQIESLTMTIADTIMRQILPKTCIDTDITKVHGSFLREDHAALPFKEGEVW